MKNLAALLQAYAREKDFNQAQLAKKIGICPKKLSKVIHLKPVDGETVISIQTWLFK